MLFEGKDLITAISERSFIDHKIDHAINEGTAFHSLFFLEIVGTLVFVWGRR